ncbi:RiPP maturation radical SAM C-methyltransferase [Desulfopila sp. IMCC35008]|uniref:RiPP maturation radical SAM C-methyltransferase n=1 Tax=Desulfopila sp. IMCC35008 TaxID=2653858 RepID=UPI0013D4BAF1|nr:RiPP maturation radical SAM C-methyltransferase [Desulfopila sp. IMCC35008]
MAGSTDTNRIALVSMPWAIFSRPSIQVGALKAYTEAHSGFLVEGFHPYLQLAKTIGIENYHAIAADGWAGEAIFSSLLFPEQNREAEKLYRKGTGKQNLPDFLTLVEQTRSVCSSWLQSINWDNYMAVGFTLCFYQLLPSLYMAAQLKQRHPSVPVIFGGSSCGGELGRSLVSCFPQINYIVDGEGEIPFLQLLHHLQDNTKPFPERVLSTVMATEISPSPEVSDLSSLPTPDYSPYFRETKHLFPDMPFIPEIPLEFSRGCWWHKCTFCNLNLQWKKYRWKNAETMLLDLKNLATSHQCLDFCFTDNALPPNEADILFKSLENAPVDLRFFAEIRGNTDSSTLQNYARAGLAVIQVGIESFSSSLLTSMKKGVTVIENIAVMKHAAQAGIELEGNLIVEFPGSTEEQVKQTLETLKYVVPFKPLAIATFFLGHGSPIHRCPKEYGISGLVPHHKNKALIPQELLTNLHLLAGEYRGDRTHQRKLWKEVRNRVDQWHSFHNNRRANSTPPLAYRDGGTFLIIRQEQPDGPVLRHRLTGTSREIYLFLKEIRTFDEVCDRFKTFKPEALQTYINQLCRKKLLYRENEKIISLALHDTCG